MFLAAIIEFFHLLPLAAHKFLDELLTLIIDLEGALPPGQFYSEINSPYRAPLTKYLNRHATLVVDYFLARFSEPRYFRRYILIWWDNFLMYRCKPKLAQPSYLLPFVGLCFLFVCFFGVGWGCSY